MAMTDRERIDCLMQGKKPDRVPYFAFLGEEFSSVSVGKGIGLLFRDVPQALELYNKAQATYKWLYTPHIAYASAGAWELGGEIKLPKGEFDQAPSVVRHAATTEEEAMALKVPDDLSERAMVPIVKQLAQLLLAQNPQRGAWRLVLHLEGTFTFASNMVGAATLARWVIKKPDAANHVLGVARDYIIKLGAYYKSLYGTDNILIWSGEPTSSNQLISPKIFEKYVSPFNLAVHEKVLGMGFPHYFKHICGDQKMNLPYWSRIPLSRPGYKGFASFGPEVELTEGAAARPNDVIVGNLQPSHILAHTPEEVYQETRKIIEIGKKLPNGFMFSAGCAVPPIAPPENMLAITRALDDFGAY